MSDLVAVRALLAMGYEVVIFEHPSARQKRVRQSRMLLDSAKGKLTIFYGDISDAPTMSALEDSLQSKDVRAVLHLAGIIPPLATRAPELAQRINVEGTQNVIALCKHLPKPPRIVFASSIALYGDRLANPWISVQDPLCPNDAYALTKHSAKPCSRKRSPLDYSSAFLCGGKRLATLGSAAVRSSVSNTLLR